MLVENTDVSQKRILYFYDYEPIYEELQKIKEKKTHKKVINI